MSFRLFAISGAGALLLSACNTPPLGQAGSLDAGWGEASRYNAAVQTIDPEPAYAEGDAQPGDHGEKGAKAVQRYRTDQVKDTEPARSTSRTSSGSGPR